LGKWRGSLLQRRPAVLFLLAQGLAAGPDA
jgi:hypothetical protein